MQTPRTARAIGLGQALAACLAATACGGGSSNAMGEGGSHTHGDRSRGAHSHDEGEPADGEHAHGHHAHHGRGNAEHGHRVGHSHDFSDVDRFATMFDAPERDAWQRPDEVVALLAIEEGQRVVDLGAGTGYFVPHLVGPVGAGGRVLALDVEPAMVEHMRVRFGDAGYENAEPRVIETSGTGLEAASVDRVLVVNTWHHLEDRVAYARGLLTTLRPGGRLVVVDFTADAPEGPPPAMRLAPDVVLEELRQAGFAVELAEESLPRQYVVVGQVP